METHASESVKDIDVVAGVEIIDGTFTVDFKGVFVHFDVYRAPPDVILGRLFVDDTLVLGRSAGLFAGKVDEGTGRGNHGTYGYVSNGYIRTESTYLRIGRHPRRAEQQERCA